MLPLSIEAGVPRLELALEPLLRRELLQLLELLLRRVIGRGAELLPGAAARARARSAPRIAETREEQEKPTHMSAMAASNVAILVEVLTWQAHNTCQNRQVFSSAECAESCDLSKVLLAEQLGLLLAERQDLVDDRRVVLALALLRGQRAPARPRTIRMRFSIHRPSRSTSQHTYKLMLLLPADHSPLVRARTWPHTSSREGYGP